MLSTYGLEIYVDGNLVGKLAHGANEDYDLSLAAGRHEFLVCRDGKNSVKGTHSFTIEGVSTAEFEVECKSSRVNIKEPTVTLTGDAAMDAGAVESEQTEQTTTERAEQTTADATAETARPTDGEQSGSGSGSGGFADAVITVNNNADFEKLVTSTSTDAGWFADAYSGRTVEFDGYVADIAAHEGKRARWDILIYYGDSGAARGPNFKFSDIGLTNLGLKGDYLSNDTDVHVVAKVSSYNKTQDLLFLTPVSMVER